MGEIEKNWASWAGIGAQPEAEVRGRSVYSLLMQVAQRTIRSASSRSPPSLIWIVRAKAQNPKGVR